MSRCQILSFWVSNTNMDDFLSAEDRAKSGTIADLIERRLSVLYVSEVFIY